MTNGNLDSVLRLDDDRDELVERVKQLEATFGALYLNLQAEAWGNSHCSECRYQRLSLWAALRVSGSLMVEHLDKADSDVLARV